MRRIIIGDIQGCVQQLEALLAAVPVRADDSLYCVGDLVNRGPDSLGVLRRLRELNARVVLGNHDLHLLQIAAGTRRVAVTDRLDAVLHARDCDALFDWLIDRPVLHVEADMIVVHAGLHPTWRDIPTLAMQVNDSVAAHVQGRRDARIVFASEVRFCDASGRRPPSDDPPPGAPFRPWDEFYDGERIVVFGHWARRSLVVTPRVRGVDTGCVYGGALTAWIVEEDRFVHVPGWRP
jgi:bis(5'-nucleosyl)-tetraphosphatase (symmetrical)